MRILAKWRDLTPPVVSSVTPSGTVSGTITITANVTDNYNVVGVQFKMDGVNIGGEDLSAPFQVSYDTHLLGNGGHTITAVARDAQGNTTTYNQGINVSNSTPSAGYVYWGSVEQYTEEDGWFSYRASPPDYDHRWNSLIDGTDTRWSNYPGSGAFPTLYLPGNPDPTHYQMRVSWYGGWVEGGSDGNHVYMAMVIFGGEQIVYDNGGNGWQSNCNGGESMQMLRWCSSPGWNTCQCQDVRAYYDFVVKPGYNS